MVVNEKKILIFHLNSNSFYKNIVFNAFSKMYKNFKVIFIAESRKIRSWKVDFSYLEFPYRVLFNEDLENIKKFKLYRILLKTLKMENPDILYIGGYSYIFYWVILFWGRLKGKKIIFEMDSNIEKPDEKKFFFLVKKIFVKLCDYGITYGKLSKEYFKKLGMTDKKIVLKPNVTDNRFWKSMSIKNSKKIEKLISKYRVKKKNLIYVGRFSKEKNLFFLLEAYNDAKQITMDVDWGLILIGDGPLKQDIQLFIKNNDIPDTKILGFMDREEISEIYSIGDIIILPSISETWGMVINEAMNFGLTVFVSKISGSSAELVKEGMNGFIFSPLKKDKLTSLILKAFNGKIDLEKFSENSKRIILEFTPKVAAGKIKELVDDIK